MGRKVNEDVVHDGSVRKWHPWKDSLGMPYAPMFWRNGTISTVSGSVLCYCSSLSELIAEVTHRKLFVLCDDLLSEHDFSFVNELLGAKEARPYLSRSGGITALRLSSKKQNGFLVPASTWGMRGEPTQEYLQAVIDVFRLFNIESVTPASLSEKILRRTLPDKLSIYRPSLILRKDVLDNHRGGRIDTAQSGQFYSSVYEYDKNKAYLFHASPVPSPFQAPTLCSYPSIDRAFSFATGYWHVRLRAVRTAIPPILIDGRAPQEGEEISMWLWSEELRKCVEAGYMVEEITRGYGWKEMSDFMSEWRDILWKKWQQAEHISEEVRDIIKSMMVGLPGRFLRAPMYYSLIPLSEARARPRDGQEGDLALQLHWKEPGDRIFSDFAIRPIYDPESTALSPIGSYIVMKMRVELYEMMLKEYNNGRKVLSSYIDQYRINGITTLEDNLGKGLGQWKEKRYGPSWIEENRLVGANLGTGKIDVKAPGYAKDGERRQGLLDEYLKKV
jgi:hypothetical protein